MQFAQTQETGDVSKHPQLGAGPDEIGSLRIVQGGVQTQGIHSHTSTGLGYDGFAIFVPLQFSHVQFSQSHIISRLYGSNSGKVGGRSVVPLHGLHSQGSQKQ